MRIVLDANILMSCLISPNSSDRELLLNSDAEFFAPNFLFAELFLHKEKILSHSKLDEVSLHEYLHEMLEIVQFIHLDLVSNKHRQKAYYLCKDIDVKDTIYVALCLELDARLWSKDKKLKRHLVKGGFKKFFEPEP